MDDPLSSWNDTLTKRAVLDFVVSVCDASGPAYVPPAERVAVFDNDGTLWCEKPLYVQLDYLLRTMAAFAEADPSLHERQPWRAAIERDLRWFDLALTQYYRGEGQDLHTLFGGILAVSEGREVETVEAEARAFVMSEKHPTLGRGYQACAYQPMLELLRYLEVNGFSNWIVSGGGRDFMRGFSAELYGIPRQRVIGSTVAYRYLDDAGGGSIVQQAELAVMDDGPGKPVQIWNVIGCRPILAAGNSNGDVPMLRFARRSGGHPLRLLVVHDDAPREFEYSAGAEQALRAAGEQGWTQVRIREDWRRVFAGG
jgi:phosphoserine phosphatase